MSRLPMPADTAEFSEETRTAMRHILKTRTTVPPPSSYLTYSGSCISLPGPSATPFASSGVLVFAAWS